MSYKIGFLSVVPLVAAVLAGGLIPVQATSGAALGRALGSPLWGAAVALFIGTVAIVLAAASVGTPLPTAQAAVSGPWWMWIGGLTGAIYVVSALVLLPRVGAGTFVICVIAGQMLIATLLDHFGMLGLPTKAVTLPRIVGIAVIFVGIIITQYSGTNSR